VRKPKEYGRNPALLRQTMPDLGQDVTCRRRLHYSLTQVTRYWRTGLYRQSCKWGW